VLFIIYCFKEDNLFDFLLELSIFLKLLLNNNTTRGKYFRKYICAYNSALTFIYYIYIVDIRLQDYNKIQTFIIYSKLYYLQDFLYISTNSLFSFAQLYFLDSNYIAIVRFVQYFNLYHALLAKLAQIIYNCNNLFISIYAIVQEQITIVRVSTKIIHIVINLQLQFIIKNNSNKRRYNLFITNKIAIFILNKYKNCFYRNIVIAKRCVNSKKLRFYRISYTNVVYFLLYYIFFFKNNLD